MGYTISLKIEDSKLRAEVFSFMRNNYVPFGKLLGYKDEYVRGPLTTDLSYDHDPSIIGFDYVSGPDGWYVTFLLRVIAIKLGISCTRYDGENEIFTWEIGDPLDTKLFRDSHEEKCVEEELKRISELWDQKNQNWRREK